jgi:hypothetical protein
MGYVAKGDGENEGRRKGDSVPSQCEDELFDAGYPEEEKEEAADTDETNHKPESLLYALGTED